MSDIEDKESLEGKFQNLQISDTRRITRSSSRVGSAPRNYQEYKFPQLTQVKRANTRIIKKPPKFPIEENDNFKLSSISTLDINKIESTTFENLKDSDKTFSDSELCRKPSRRKSTQIKRRNTKTLKNTDKTLESSNKFVINVQFESDNAEILNENFLIKKDLDLTSVSDVIGRTVEIEKVTTFIDDKLVKGENGSMYISGVPGTGKTMVITKLMESYVKTRNARYYFINCMSFGVGNTIFEHISSLLNITNKGLHNIEDYFSNNKQSKPLFIVLDEIDQLVSRDNSKLYRIFNWSEISEIPLIIIGISNSLALTERNLPYLKLKKYPPHHINFPAYSSKELQDIILARLDNHKSTAKIDRAAIHFCCSKVASKTGDARNALSLLTEAAKIQNTETDKLIDNDDDKNQEKENKFESPKKEFILTKTPMSTPQMLARKMSSRVAMPSSPSVKHVQKAILKLEQVTDPFQILNPGNDSEQSEQLPLQHKLVLCSALSLRDKLQKQNQKSKFKLKSALTVANVYDHYCFITKQLGLSILCQSEIISICDLLDASCLARLGPMGKDLYAANRTFTLPLDIEGVRNALGDQELLSRVMTLGNN